MTLTAWAEKPRLSGDRNEEVSSIRGNVTGRTAVDLLPINNNFFPQPCGIPGKTSANPIVCSQGLIIGWQSTLSVFVERTVHDNLMSEPGSDNPRMSIFEMLRLTPQS